jgi:hypothetical protein
MIARKNFILQHRISTLFFYTRPTGLAVSSPQRRESLTNNLILRDSYLSGNDTAIHTVRHTELVSGLPPNNPNFTIISVASSLRGAKRRGNPVATIANETRNLLKSTALFTEFSSHSLFFDSTVGRFIIEA